MNKTTCASDPFLTKCWPRGPFLHVGGGAIILLMGDFFLSGKLSLHMRAFSLCGGPFSSHGGLFYGLQAPMP